MVPSSAEPLFNSLATLHCKNYRPPRPTRVGSHTCKDGSGGHAGGGRGSGGAGGDGPEQRRQRPLRKRAVAARRARRHAQRRQRAQRIQLPHLDACRASGHVRQGHTRRPASQAARLQYTGQGQTGANRTVGHSSEHAGQCHEQAALAWDIGRQQPCRQTHRAASAGLPAHRRSRILEGTRRAGEGRPAGFATTPPRTEQVCTSACTTHQVSKGGQAKQLLTETAAAHRAGLRPGARAAGAAGPGRTRC
jgi:hypothetical protein